MKLNRYVLAATPGVAMMLISGCATQPISNAEAVSIGPKSILTSSLTQQRANTYPVTIKRDAGFMGSACSTRIFANGQPIADIRNSQKVVVFLPEGDHIFSARPNGICAGGVSETRASVKSSNALNLRVAYGTNGDFFINVTAF